MTLFMTCCISIAVILYMICAFVFFLVLVCVISGSTQHYSHKCVAQSDNSGKKLILKIGLLCLFWFPMAIFALCICAFDKNTDITKIYPHTVARKECETCELNQNCIFIGTYGKCKQEAKIYEIQPISNVLK